MQEALPSDVLSRLIGSIYDCALDPGLWDETLVDIKALLRCYNAQLVILDTALGHASLMKTNSVDAYLLERQREYFAEVSEWERYSC